MHSISVGVGATIKRVHNYHEKLLAKSVYAKNNICIKTFREWRLPEKIDDGNE